MSVLRVPAIVDASGDIHQYYKYASMNNSNTANHCSRIESRLLCALGGKSPPDAPP